MDNGLGDGSVTRNGQADVDDIDEQFIDRNRDAQADIADIASLSQEGMDVGIPYATDDDSVNDVDSDITVPDSDDAMMVEEEEILEADNSQLADDYLEYLRGLPGDGIPAEELSDNVQDTEPESYRGDWDGFGSKKQLLLFFLRYGSPVIFSRTQLDLIWFVLRELGVDPTPRKQLEALRNQLHTAEFVSDKCDEEGRHFAVKSVDKTI